MAKSRVNNYYDLVAPSPGARICPRTEGICRDTTHKKHSNTITAMRHKTPTAILGYTIVILTVGAAVSHTMTTEAHGDHVDNHIWIETADGNYVKRTNAVWNYIHDIYGATESDRQWEVDTEESSIEIIYTLFDTRTQQEVIEKVDWNMAMSATGYTTTVNDATFFSHNWCGSETSEKESIEEQATEKEFRTTWLGKQEHNDSPRYIYVSGKVEPDQYKKWHENICGYFYTNVLKDRYTYTITNLPASSKIPLGYNDIVKAGVEAGLNSWGKINDIEFRYTDSRLEADIIIQQQIGDGRAYGNAETGCIFGSQCTIQLFTDFNGDHIRRPDLYEQELLNKHGIAHTIAHEFGHIIGLPHHIDAEHIMNTVHASSVRTYYEARNINIVKVAEPTHEQMLLGYTGSETFTPLNKESIKKDGHVHVGFSNECKEPNECFNPSTITIGVGGTIGWSHRDLISHRITSGNPGERNNIFDSGTLQQVIPFTHTFEEAGKYPYFCSIHPWMKGTVIVLGHEDTETETIDYTNIDQLIEHPISINFIEFIKTIIANADAETAIEYMNKLAEKLAE